MLTEFYFIPILNYEMSVTGKFASFDQLDIGSLVSLCADKPGYVKKLTPIYTLFRDNVIPEQIITSYFANNNHYYSLLWKNSEYYMRISQFDDKTSITRKISNLSSISFDQYAAALTNDPSNDEIIYLLIGYNGKVRGPSNSAIVGIPDSSILIKFRSENIRYIVKLNDLRGTRRLAVKTDNNGRVYIAGTGFDETGIIVKIQAGGSILWSKSISYNNLPTFFLDLAVNSKIYLSGYYTDAMNRNAGLLLSINEKDGNPVTSLIGTIEGPSKSYHYIASVFTNDKEIYLATMARGTKITFADKNTYLHGDEIILYKILDGDDVKKILRIPIIAPNIQEETSSSLVYMPYMLIINQQFYVIYLSGQKVYVLCYDYNLSLQQEIIFTNFNIISNSLPMAGNGNIISVSGWAINPVIIDNIGVFPIDGAGMVHQAGISFYFTRHLPDVIGIVVGKTATEAVIGFAGKFTTLENLTPNTNYYINTSGELTENSYGNKHYLTAINEHTGIVKMV